MTDWLLDPDVAYLNHGSFGALPTVVGEAAADLRAMMERNPNDLLARRLAAMVDDIRGRVCQLLNGEPADCVFVPNTTTGTATVLTALSRTFDAGDEILTTDHRYGAIAAQLGAAASQAGIVPVSASVPVESATVADVIAAITDRITSRTRLVVVDSVASLSGFVFPVAEIVATVHDRGLPILVDAAHAPAQIEVDLAAINADFWVGNLHKWVCSPRAAGVMSVAPQWRDVVRPLVASHRYPEGYHQAFDWTGTFDPVPVLAIPAALDFWETVGWDNARETRRRLVDDGAGRVAKALGTVAPAADQFRAAMRVVELPQPLSDEQILRVEAALSTDHRIEAALMQLQGRSWVRVCAQVYNTAADYDRLALALPKVLPLS
jgi:isopenicillin-N epimerase